MKKPTKKLMTIITASALILAMAMPTMAANSTSTGSNSTSTGSNSTSTGSNSTSTGSDSSDSSSADVVTITAEPVVIDGVTYEVTFSEPSDEVKAEIDTTDELIELLGNSYIANSEVTVLGAQDVDIPNITAEALEAGVPITFNISSVQAGDVIKVLHKRSTDGVWEVLDTEVTDGQVTVTFHSFSPVVFVKMTSDTTATDTDSTSITDSDSTSSTDSDSTSSTDSDSTSSTDSDSTSSDSSSLTSPKTGMSNMVYIMSILSIASFAGIATVAKRSKAN